MKFDYYNSAKRKNYYFQKKFVPIFNLAVFLFALMLIWAGYLTWLENTSLAKLITGIALFFMSGLLYLRFSGLSKIDSANIVDRFSDNLIEMFEWAVTSAERDGKREISLEYLVARGTQSPEVKMIMLRLGSPVSKTLPIKYFPVGPKFACTVSEVAEDISGKEITIPDFLEQAFQKSIILQNYMSDIDLTFDQFDIVVKWLKALKLRNQVPKIWEKSKASAGIGQDWSYGYAPVLSRFSYDISRGLENFQGEIDVFSHRQKLDDIQAALVRNSKNNVLLCGEPGSGRQTLVDALAVKLVKGDCLPALRYLRVRRLDVGRLVSGAQRGELEARLEGVFVDAVNAGNIVLYIDNLQSLIGSGSNEVGAVDASQILIPFLRNSRLRVIATVTPDDYYNKIANNNLVYSSFEKIDIEPQSQEDTLAIMLERVAEVEIKNNVFFPVQALQEIVDLSAKYIHDVPFPEKALKLMETCGVTHASGKVTVIRPLDVQNLIAKKTKVPIGEVHEEEKDKLLHLEDFLHDRVVGQEEAITAISDALRRVRSGLASGKRPAGVFLFLGPTGVGKTETAKALAENYFGSENKMIRLDMSEYHQPESVDRLIGSAQHNGVLITAISENPFSLILLDEIEKADRNILNVFLQLFEDGRLTDARGKVHDFTNAIIIATSNAGAGFIREKTLADPGSNIKDDLVNKLQTEATFSPEFLNRFDEIVVFKPLAKEQLIQVAGIMIGNLNKTLASRDIKVEVGKIALEKLVQEGNDPQFGARPMRRVIQRKIENLLAKKMLKGEIQKGQVVRIGSSDI